MQRKTKTLLSILVCTILIMTNTVTYIFAATPSQATYLSPGSLTESASYIFWVESPNYFCKDGITGQITSSTNIASLSNTAIATMSTSGGLLHYKTGTYTLESTIVIPYDRIMIEGESGTVFDVGTATITAIEFKPTSGTIWKCGMRDVMITATTQPLGSVGLSIQESISNGEFDNIHIFGFEVGLNISKSYLCEYTNILTNYCTTGVSLGRVSGSVFSLLSMEHCNDGLVSYEGSTGVTFIEPHAETNTNNGIEFAYRQKGLAIIGGYIANNGFKGLLITGESNVYPSEGILIRGGYYLGNYINLEIGRCNGSTIEGIHSNASLDSGIKIGGFNGFHFSIKDNYLLDTTPVLISENAYNYTFENNYGFITEQRGDSLVTEGSWIPTDELYGKATWVQATSGNRTAHVTVTEIGNTAFKVDIFDVQYNQTWAGNCVVFWESKYQP